MTVVCLPLWKGWLLEISAMGRVLSSQLVDRHAYNEDLGLKVPERKFSRRQSQLQGDQELAVDICQATGHQCPLSIVLLKYVFPLPPPVPLCWTPKAHNQQLVGEEME